MPAFHRNVLVLAPIALALAGCATSPFKPIIEQPSPGIKRESIKRMDTLAHRLSQADRFSGAIVITRDGDEIFARGYGLADRERGVMAGPDTAFYLASVGKMFTMVAVLQLVEQGRIDLDTPFANYVTDYPDPEVAARITIRQLLRHSSGLGDLPIFGPENAERRATLVTLEDYVRANAGMQPSFEPGTDFAYSNYGYLLLGLVVERVSGQAYADYLLQHIFIPAGMTNTGFPPREELRTDLARGYTLMDGKLGYNGSTLPRSGSPAGGGVASARDMTRFADALDKGVLLHDPWRQRLLSPDNREAALGMPFSPDDPRWWGHGGGAEGMSTDVRHYPDKETSVAILANRDPQVANEIAGYFAYLIDGGDFDEALFLRGSMNNWDAREALKLGHDGARRVEVYLAEGNYEFKIGTGDWRTFDLGGGEVATAVVPDDIPRPLHTGGGNLSINITQAGTYRFTLTGLEDGLPMLAISPIR